MRLTIALPIAAADFSRTLLNQYSSPRNLHSDKYTSPTRKILPFGIDFSRKYYSAVVEKSKVFLPRAAMEGRISSDSSSSEEEELYEAREAEVDEEYWAVAWLRGECQWEARENYDNRNAEDFKRMFADQEFDALKEKCNSQLGNKCKCIIMVRKEDGTAKEISVSRIVASLDFYVRCFSPGQTIPEQRVMGPPPVGVMDPSGSNSYGYISNVCVAKSVRREGLASTMLQHAISTAKDQGIKKVFLGVHRENEGAMRLYEKVGFKKVDAPNLTSSHPLLMCFEDST